MTDLAHYGDTTAHTDRHGQEVLTEHAGPCLHDRPCDGPDPVTTRWIAECPEEAAAWQAAWQAEKVEAASRRAAILAELRQMWHVRPGESQ